MKNFACFLLIGSFFLFTSCKEKEVNIPDEAFLNFCLTHFDANDDGKIQVKEVNQITTLDVEDLNIQSLDGIEHFTALTQLNCIQNRLTQLNLLKNKALAELYCSWNFLSTLDMSKNIALTILNCSNNQLDALDVSKNTDLLQLGCYANQLTTLDVSKNTMLELLYCRDNEFTTLNLSHNTLLTELDCTNNPIDTIYVWPEFSTEMPLVQWSKPDNTNYVNQP